MTIKLVLLSPSRGGPHCLTCHIIVMSWKLLERTVYRLPYAPPRVRKEPMQVFCVGFPRTGTESLQQALITLGYDYTYHGWDILFEQPLYSDKWVDLERRKFKVHTNNRSILDDDCKITAAEFDEVFGRCTAVTDAAGSVFAAELIEAYPDAKVVLNIRRDEDAWYQSACKTLVGEIRPAHYILSWSCTEAFWGLACILEVSLGLPVPSSGWR